MSPSLRKPYFDVNFQNHIIQFFLLQSPHTFPIWCLCLTLHIKYLIKEIPLLFSRFKKTSERRSGFIRRCCLIITLFWQGTKELLSGIRYSFDFDIFSLYCCLSEGWLMGSHTLNILTTASTIVMGSWYAELFFYYFIFVFFWTCVIYNLCYCF